MTTPITVARMIADDRRAVAPPALTSSVPVGSVWAGKLDENPGKRIRIESIAPDGKLLAVDVKTGRKSSPSFSTLHARYRRETSAPTPLDTVAPTPPEPVEPPEVVELVEPIDTVTTGVALERVNGWSVYHHQREDEDTVRDLDIAERVGLANRHGVRATIRKLANDGELKAVLPGTILGSEENGLAPRAFEVEVMVKVGSGAERTVTEYHLNEAAVAVLAMHLRTSKAAALRRDIATVFVLARRGRLEEAAKLAGGQTAKPRDSLATELAAIDRLLANGVIDAPTAAVHHALAVGRATGLDLINPPAVTFGRWTPTTTPIAQLTAGQTAIVTVPVDVAGHYTANAIGRRYCPKIGGRWVGRMARDLGIFGKADFGKSTTVQDNGRDLGQAWKYNDAAREALHGPLTELAARIGSKPKGQSVQSLVAEIAAKHRQA